MTAANIARRLESRGYAFAGIVEHLDTNPKHPLSCLEALAAEFRTLDSSLDLYLGAELDFQGDAISIPDAPALKRRLGLDYCLAAAHGLGEGVTTADAYVEDHHRRLMGIVERCPYVDVVAHPWCEGARFARRGRLERWRCELVPERRLREFLDAALHHGKAIEVNHKALDSAGDPAYRRYLELLRGSSVPVTVGSDAHSMERVGDVEPLNALLRELGFGADRLWRPARC
jgi:histidinol phosphatase-like PHP family hydrolase